MNAIFRQGPDILDYTAGSAATAGDIVQLDDGRAAVIQTDIAAGDVGSVRVNGVWDIASASATLFSVGDPVYFDISAELAIKAPGATGDIFLGPALVAKISGDTLVRTDLNAVLAESAQETLTTAAPAASTFGVSIIDSSANAVDATLAAGQKIGQIKTFVMTDASNSSTLSIAAHETSDPEVATFDAVDEVLVLMWSGTEWVTLKATATFV